MNTRSLPGLLLLSLASTSAYAGGPVVQLPEPGVLALIAIALLAAAVIVIRNRRK